ncbi:MAG: hypothetical protein HN352_14515 [Bacteroidetes bacterium]|nr:hypothetical protein [Bacteroidota bacterium]MBT3750680.1 hypothetical protein [Bacteroidota bacterium]MBT4401885.1 hypothetical protein [Bacteroidota bacterium]MBT4408415.1 hypothetical protein [Bacteroidota bacterium]MBT7465827.1 hypothetical protein [Bacteroidota bacterium]
MKKTKILSALLLLAACTFLYGVQVISVDNVYAADEYNCDYNMDIDGYYTAGTYQCIWMTTAEFMADDCSEGYPFTSCEGTGCLPSTLNKNCNGKTYPPPEE